jgi:hypothetical protein
VLPDGNVGIAVGRGVLDGTVVGTTLVGATVLVGRGVLDGTVVGTPEPLLIVRTSWGLRVLVDSRLAMPVELLLGVVKTKLYVPEPVTTFGKITSVQTPLALGSELISTGPKVGALLKVMVASVHVLDVVWTL